MFMDTEPDTITLTVMLRQFGTATNFLPSIFTVMFTSIKPMRC